MVAAHATVERVLAGHGGAHQKHSPHVYGAGRVPVQRLVERRALPSQKGGGRKMGGMRGWAAVI